MSRRGALAGLLIGGLTVFAGLEDMARRHDAAISAALAGDLVREVDLHHEMVVRARELFTDAQHRLDDCARMRGI